MKTASPRNVRPAAHGLRASHTRAAREIRRRLIADRFRGLVEAAASLNLNEGDGVAPPHDKIDFAPRNDVPAGEDGIAFQPQQSRRNRFGVEAEEMRFPSASRPIEWGSGAHRAAPASSSARA